MTTFLEDEQISTEGPLGTALAEMAFGCSPLVSSALHEAINRSQLGYLAPADIEEMGTAVVGWLEREYGWSVEPAMVRPVSDLVAGFRTVLTHFVPEGEPIIVPTPGYMPFLSMPRTIGRPVIEVPMLRDDDGWCYDFEGIEKAFQSGAKMLVLCNPHNPIGKVANEAELARIEQIVHEAGGTVFSDEIHAPITMGDKPHICYAMRNERAANHTITATSASKAFNIPGVKCGQLIFTNREHLDTWNSIGHWYEHQASVLGTVAACTAYAEGRPWLDEVLEYTRENVRVALEELRGSHVACVGPEATYLLWLDLRGTPLEGSAEGPTTAELALAHANIVSTDGLACGDAGRGFIRFNAALPRPQVREAMRRLAAATAG